MHARQFHNRRTKPRRTGHLARLRSRLERLPDRWLISGDALRSGAHRLEFRRGQIYVLGAARGHLRRVVEVILDDELLYRAVAHTGPGGMSSERARLAQTDAAAELESLAAELLGVDRLVWSNKNLSR